jgi:hypothetical protein
MSAHYSLLVALVCVLGFIPSTSTASETTKSDYLRGVTAVCDGYRYMVAFPDVGAHPTERPQSRALQINISARYTTRVTINTPATINSIPVNQRSFTLRGGHVLTFNVDLGYLNTRSETRTGLGIEIVSDRPVSVSTDQLWSGNGDRARHLPVVAWGTSYYTMNFYQDQFGTAQTKFRRPAQILVIAAYDSTVVTYHPTHQTEGGEDAPSTAPGDSSTVVLNIGETFLIKGSIDTARSRDFSTDLSGTRIEANKPIGVVSGHTKVGIMRYPDQLPFSGPWVASAHFVRNNVHDAMIPNSLAGKEFVTVPCMYTPTRVTGRVPPDSGVDDDRGDVIRIVALEANTTVRMLQANGTDTVVAFVLDQPGATEINTGVEHATYWTSDKPVLMGQYGKSWANLVPRKNVFKDETPQGHPTVEAGMPMLQSVPPINRWFSHTTFSSRSGTDTYLNMAFRLSDLDKLYIDGRTLSKAFPGAIQPLPGTPYAYLRSGLGSGDHVLESADPSVFFAAWNYGSLDGMNQGTAYGVPLGVSWAQPCGDTLITSDTVTCGNVYISCSSQSSEANCAGIADVLPIQLTNYELVLDTNFVELDSSVTCSLNVVTRSLKATATVRIVSKSGRYVERTYDFTPDTIEVESLHYSFGARPLGDSVCTTIVVSNPWAHYIVVRGVRMKSLVGPFSATTSSTVIPARGSIEVDICGVVRERRAYEDTLVVVLECREVLATVVVLRADSLGTTMNESPSAPMISTSVQDDVLVIRNLPNSSTVTIADLQGRVVLTRTNTMDATLVFPQFSTLSRGTYLLSVVSTEGIHSATVFR